MQTTTPTITFEEAEKILATVQKTGSAQKALRRAVRNRCLVLFMLDAGLRVGELVQLLMADLCISSQPVNSLLVRADIAKTKTERLIPLTPRLTDCIKMLHDHFWKETTVVAEGFAFYITNPANHLTTRQVERITRSAAMKSIGRPVHPHALRHTFATRLMRRTNARVVMQLLGHARMSSTQIYTHPNQDDLKEAIQSLEHDPPKNNL